MIGRNEITGPTRATFSLVGEPAPLEDGRDRAEGGADREQVPERRLDRDRDRPEDDREQDQPDHHDPERQQGGREPRGDVDADGGVPVTVRSVTPYRSSSAPARSRISCASSAVAGSACAASGTTCTMPRSAVRFGVDSATASTPSSVRSRPRSSITPIGSVVRMMSTVTSSGVLNPGP